MWIPVRHLFAALSCAHARLPEVKRKAYLNRLGNAQAHQTALVEMIPADKVTTTTPTEFEVSGVGAGNRTIDWLIQTNQGRLVLLEVKRRSADFIEQMEALGTSGIMEPPTHEVSLLFRSVEQKFLDADPDVKLQGVWVVTDIKQEENELTVAFESLDPGKVHFAVFGDWESDIHVLARREQDRGFLLELFEAEPSSRFVFSRTVSAAESTLLR